MAKRGKIFNSIVDESKTLPEVKASEVAKALGAASVEGRSASARGPFSLWTLQNRLAKELVSSGGRPGRREAVSRKKIPLTEAEWQRLDEIAAVLRQRGVSATSGQVAGLLLHQSLSEVGSYLEGTGTRRLEKISPQPATLSDAELEETVEGVLAAAASAEVHLEQLRPVALELLRRMRVGRGAEADDESQ